MSNNPLGTSTSINMKLLPIEVSPGRRSSRSKLFLSIRHVNRLLIPLMVIVIWQLSSSVVSEHGFQLPSPTEVLKGFVELWQSGDIQSAIPASLARAGTGLVFGLGIGLVLGIANGLFRIAEEMLDSSMQIIRVVPFIAVIPLFVVWFGIGEEMKIILIALACSFPVYINTYSAVKLVDKKLIEVGETFGMNRMNIILQIIIPSAFPTILIGVRYAMSTSLLALVVAEQVNSKNGVGHIIYLASNALRIDLIMAGIIIYAVLGIIVDITMRLVEFYAMPWLNRSPL